MNNSLERWLTSKYAISWRLAIALVANYFLTGFFFGVTETSPLGVTNHVIDFVTGAVASFIILVGSLLRKKNLLVSVPRVQVLFFVSSIFAMSAAVFTRAISGFSLDSFSVVLSGFLQMIVIHNVYSVVISSLMETRSERKQLAKQRSKLNSTKETFEQQIEEINSRLTNVVNKKLTTLLSGLDSKLKSLSLESPTQLAKLISETLEEGVRPLSWKIEKSNVLSENVAQTRIKRVSLIERLNFRITFEQFAGLRILTAVYLFFEIPVMFFYFDLNAAVQTFFAIAFTVLVLWALKTFTKRFRLRSWAAILIYTILVAGGGSTFILYRLFTGELTADGAEIALVLSMVQIALLSAIFQSALVRRLTYIADQRVVNAQLEQLVSQLRQSAWVAKKNLARLVHGQVQSELFAAYLQLSQATEASQELYEQVGTRIQKAKGALSNNDRAQQSFETTMEQIVATWGSSFKVNTDISGKALAALHRDPVATACSLEVILEAVNNAAKYGTSGQANLTVDLRPASHIYIEVTNTADSSETSEAGYGSTVLDDVTHEWNFEITDGIAKLTAEVVLNQPAG